MVFLHWPGIVDVLSFLLFFFFLSPAESSRPYKNSAAVVSKQSARWQVSKELYQTESNYVGILNTVLQVQLPPSICLALWNKLFSNDTVKCGTKVPFSLLSQKAQGYCLYLDWRWKPRSSFAYLFHFVDMQVQVFLCRSAYVSSGSRLVLIEVQTTNLLQYHSSLFVELWWKRRAFCMHKLLIAYFLFQKIHF